jgi:TusE/DsrC/DsvC family sulfur relay protein
MPELQIGGRSYGVDDEGFLQDFDQWDEEFAKGIASAYGIGEGLTERHWKIIYSIREWYLKNGRCPAVYVTCRSNNLRLKQLCALFPSGYLRGACRLAGITYKQGYHPAVSLPVPDRPGVLEALRRAREIAAASPAKIYTIDVRGFLVDAGQWDEEYAIFRASDMKIVELTQRHWEVIEYLRGHHEAHGSVPTVYETCEALGMEIDELEKLFPDGYHRGAVKISGLRVI